MLYEVYGQKIAVSTLSYAVPILSFVGTAFLAHLIKSRHFLERRAAMYLGLGMMGISMLCMTGNLLGKHKLWMVLVCLVIYGSGNALLFNVT